MATAKLWFFPKIEGIIIGTGILIVLELVIHFIYINALEAQKGEIFEGLHRTGMVISTLLDEEKHQLLIKSEQEDSLVYLEQLAPLKSVIDSDSTIEFVYTMIQKKQKNGKKEIYFILDPTPPGLDANNDGIEDKSHLMDKYLSPGKELLEAFKTKTITISEEVYYDQWGGHISAFIPFYDKEQQFVGVLGIDISATTYEERLAPIRKATLRAMITTLFISYLCGLAIWFLRNFCLRIYQSKPNA